ncbi:MAG TPA: zinc ribbon domain-containing protein [Gemmatimonadales bacterium]|nr:zinc ribbon domain-containing protein [Gemmatimonadales bacterium]
MLLEAVAAVLVAVLALWFVLQPLFHPAAAPPAPYEPLEPEETPTGRALTALKEIEFDRETGKLSDADYQELKDKYTVAAVAAMRADRAAGAPEDLEQMIAARVRRLRAGPGAEPACPTCGPRPEPDAIFCSTCGARLQAPPACAACGAPLQPDGHFCEACGRRVAA